MNSVELYNYKRNYSPETLRFILIRRDDGGLGADGAWVFGTSSLNDVVHILSLFANVPTEWRRAFADVSLLWFELWDRL